jgi:excisionase family DNA binding protein
VLTLAEAAAYLRLSAPEIVQLVREQGLPGRLLGDDGRFLKAALQLWLATPFTPSRTEFWGTHFGALKDDPYLEEMLREIYKRRGRAETEEP